MTISEDTDKDGWRTGIGRKTVITGVVDLAYELGVSPSHLSRVLHEGRRPGIRLRAALAARGINVGPLVRRGEPNQPDPSTGPMKGNQP